MNTAINLFKRRRKQEMSAILIRNIDSDEEFHFLLLLLDNWIDSRELKNILHTIITITGKTDLFDPQPSLEDSDRFVLN
jgi:hypothetical protein